MSEFNLKARSPLGGFNEAFAGATLQEVTGQTIVSIAAPNDGEENLSNAIQKAYGIGPLEVGRSQSAIAESMGEDMGVAQGEGIRFLRLQRDLIFAIFKDDEREGHPGADAIRSKLGNAGYYTDQSDAWVLLQISGPLSRDALARICSIDLHVHAFDIDELARTLMEHMDAIIVRVDDDAFLLLSARSSARSFLHAVETSIRNVS